MLRRKLFGGRMLRPVQWQDIAGALGVAAFAFGFLAEPSVIVPVAAAFAHLAARAVVRDPPLWWMWILPGATVAIALPWKPFAVLAGIGLGVFLVFARRGADPLGRSAAQWLLVAVPAFLWLASRPQMEAVLQPALLGGAAALAVVVWFAVQRTISSKGS